MAQVCAFYAPLPAACLSGVKKRKKKSVLLCLLKNNFTKPATCPMVDQSQNLTACELHALSISGYPDNVPQILLVLFQALSTVFDLLLTHIVFGHSFWQLGSQFTDPGHCLP